MEKAKKIKIIKITTFSALCAICAYLTYSVIGYLVVWLQQPRFVNASGITTASLGFMVQFFIFGLLLLISIAATITLGILFFKKKKQ